MRLHAACSTCTGAEYLFAGEEPSILAVASGG